MSTHGKLLQHGKPHRRGAKPQPDSREGQVGPTGVADGFVVPGKPGNSGGGKGPEFKEVGRRGKGQGEWREPIHLPMNVQDLKASAHTERSRDRGVCFLVREPDAGNPQVLARSSVSTPRSSNQDLRISRIRLSDK